MVDTLLISNAGQAADFSVRQGVDDVVIGASMQRA
jgi:hypothetical protein